MSVAATDPAAAGDCLRVFPTDKKYQVVYADPPWEYSSSGNMPDKPYQTMTLAALKELPVARAVARDACLFMWATNPLLKEALELMEAWGFRYVTVYKTWLKRTASGKRACTPGYWSMSSTELLLLGTRGRMQRYKRVNDVKQEIECERLGHSEKPACIRNEIEALLDVGARLEIFARHVVDRWDAWGLEVPGYFHDCDAGPHSSSSASDSGRVVVFLLLNPNTGRVRLHHRVVGTADAASQTDRKTIPDRPPRRPLAIAAAAAAAAAVAADASDAASSESPPSPTDAGPTPQKLAAGLERVPVLRDGKPLVGIARPSVKHFERWWNGSGSEGRPRRLVYTVDPAYLSASPQLQEVVRGSAAVPA